MQFTVRRRAAAAVLSATLAAVVVPSLPAAAATTPVALRCTTTAFGVAHEAATELYDVRATAPATMDNGATLIIGLGLDRLPATPVALTDVTVRTTARLSLELPTEPAIVVEDMTAVSSPPVDLDAWDRLPGSPQFSFVEQITSPNAGDVLGVHVESFTVEYLTGDVGMAGAVVECLPVGASLVDSVLVVGLPPVCVPLVTCIGEQTFVGDPPDGALTMDLGPGDADEPIEFPVTGSSSTGGVVEVAGLGLARISDRRTLPLGWSLTAQLDGPLVRDGQPGIDASAVTIGDISCGQTPGAAGSAPSAEGEGGALSSPVELCAVSAGSLGSTGAAGGQWDVLGTLSLAVPPFAASGTYSGIIVLTLT